MSREKSLQLLFSTEDPSGEAFSRIASESSGNIIRSECPVYNTPDRHLPMQLPSDSQVDTRYFKFEKKHVKKEKLTTYGVLKGEFVKNEPDIAKVIISILPAISNHGHTVTLTHFTMELLGASKQMFINKLASYCVTVYSIVKDKEHKITCAEQEKDLHFNEHGIISTTFDLLKPEDLKDSISETVLLQYTVKLSSSTLLS